MLIKRRLLYIKLFKKIRPQRIELLKVQIQAVATRRSEKLDTFIKNLELNPSINNSALNAPLLNPCSSNST